MGDDMKARFQRAGYLYKLPMSKSNSERWQRRLMVAKDGYLLYYSDKKQITSTFDTKVKGIVPLGGCTVEPVKRGPGGREFGLRVDHPDFLAGRCLILSCDSEEEQEQWMKTLRDCGRVTMENALLGDAMIEKLKAEGTALEAEKETAMNKLQSEAMKLEQERSEKAELMTKADKLRQEAEAAKEEQNSLREEMEKQRAQVLEQQEKTRKLLEEKAQHAKQLEQAADRVKKLSEEKGLTETQLQEAESEARRLAEAREELAEEQSRLEESLQSMSKQAEDLQRDLVDKEKKMSDMASKLKSMKDNEDRLEKEIRARLRLQRKLMIAEDSLKRLDAALRKAGVKLDIDTRADVQKLMQFFEERVDEVRKDANSIEIMKNALRAKREYMTGSHSVDSGKLKAEDVPEPELSDEEGGKKPAAGGGAGEGKAAANGAEGGDGSDSDDGTW